MFLVLLKLQIKKIHSCLADSEKIPGRMIWINDRKLNYLKSFDNPN